MSEEYIVVSLAVLTPSVDDKIAAVINKILLNLFQPVIKPYHVMSLWSAGTCHVESAFHTVTSVVSSPAYIKIILALRQKYVNAPCIA